MNIILASKWFAWPPHFIHDAVAGLRELIMWIEIVIEFITREWF